jgi:hypothetical protein
LRGGKSVQGLLDFERIEAVLRSRLGHRIQRHERPAAGPTLDRIPIHGPRNVGIEPLDVPLLPQDRHKCLLDNVFCLFMVA